ncbi:hypothetical protein V8C42DRAFT_269733 [Trichoderma barbatum]
MLLLKGWEGTEITVTYSWKRIFDMPAHTYSQVCKVMYGVYEGAILEKSARLRQGGIMFWGVFFSSSLFFFLTQCLKSFWGGKNHAERRNDEIEREREEGSWVGDFNSSRGGVDFTPGIFLFSPLVCVTDNSRALTSKAREGEFAWRPLFTHPSIIFGASIARLYTHCLGWSVGCIQDCTKHHQIALTASSFSQVSGATSTVPLGDVSQSHTVRHTPLPPYCVVVQPKYWHYVTNEAGGHGWISNASTKEYNLVRKKGTKAAAERICGAHTTTSGKDRIDRGSASAPAALISKNPLVPPAQKRKKRERRGERERRKIRNYYRYGVPVRSGRSACCLLLLPYLLCLPPYSFS